MLRVKRRSPASAQIDGIECALREPNEVPGRTGPGRGIRGRDLRGRGRGREVRGRFREGFTLTELLVVSGIIAVLIALLLPALKWLQRSGAMARELSAARQLMIAYTSYAYDHDGVLMPGYYNPEGIPPLQVFDADGNAITGIPSWRYPWRLAPYIDYNFQGLYLDPTVQAAMGAWPDAIYTLSVHPSFGINGAFVGGDTGYFAYSQNPLLPPELRDHYLTRLSKARHPSRLIVFASARANNDIPGGPPEEILEGFHRLFPPYFTDRLWVNEYDEAAENPGDFGHISLRLGHRLAGIGYLDGSTGTLGEGEIQDMRHWADQATAPDWVVGQ